MWAFQKELKRPIEDPSKSHWMNLLPGLQGMEILKLGTSRIEIVRSLALQSGKGITCVGSAAAALTGSVAAVRGSLDEVPSNSFDLVVLDEPGFFSGSPSAAAFTTCLKNITRVLREGGWVLLCLPEGFSYARYRYGLRRKAAVAGLHDVKYYFCDPSSENPLTIIPFSRDPWSAIRYLCELEPGSRANGTFHLKRRLKRILYRALSIYNPRLAVVAVAQKLRPGEETHARSVYDTVVEHCSAPHDQPPSSLVVLSTRPYEAKNVFLAYNTNAGAVSAVAKHADHRHYAAERVIREHENLLRLRPHVEVWERKRLFVPRIIHSETNEQSTLFIMTAARGQRLDGIVGECFQQEDRPAIRKLLQGFVDAQALIQEEIAQGGRGGFPSIDPRYFENYLQLPEVDASLRRLAAPSCDFLQHGDYATVNLFFDSSSEILGVIDWEWTAYGYPPLFDLFSFFRSLVYTEGSHRGKNWVEHYRRSFVDSFFKQSWFSQAQQETLRRYCGRFGIDLQLTFDFFVGFLLIQGNRYRQEDVTWTEFASLYEDMLRYALRNKDQFVLGRGDS